MTDNLLKTALREAASREFADMPQSDGDITYTFSPRFTRRMNRLAKAEKSWLWRMTSTASKRAAAAGIAMILIALTACSIPAIREPVAAFFKGTYENCVRFFMDLRRSIPWIMTRASLWCTEMRMERRLYCHRA